MTFGEMIRTWRTAAGRTQRQLADELGCTDGFIAQMESESKLPSLEMCMALARAFRLNAADREGLVTAVEQARSLRTERRSRSRAAAVGTLRIRGSEPAGLPPDSVQPDAETLGRELACDPALLSAYRDLRVALSDPRQRETVMQALKLFARAAGVEDQQDSPEGEDLRANERR